jgi:hypothetical protein
VIRGDLPRARALTSKISAARLVDPSAASTARSIAFSSSRTLPGQQCLGQGRAAASRHERRTAVKPIFGVEAGPVAVAGCRARRSDSLSFE